MPDEWKEIKLMLVAISIIFLSHVNAQAEENFIYRGSSIILRTFYGTDFSNH